MLPEVAKFLERFNNGVHDAERFCFLTRAIEFQEAAIPKLEQLATDGEALKCALASRSENDAANFLLGLVSICAALSSELRMFVALKNDDANSAWGHLVSAQSQASTAIKAHDSFAYLEGYSNKLDAQEKLFFPPQTFCSPGFIVRKSKCSICNSDYGKCEHIKGRAYAGQFCIRIIEQAELLEMSIVEEPANKNARAYSFSDKDGDRDIMTWRIREKKTSDGGATTPHSEKQGTSSKILMLPSGSSACAKDSTHFPPEAVTSVDSWLNRKPPTDLPKGQ